MVRVDMEGTASMQTPALLLSGAGPSPELGRVERLLAFFGIPCLEARAADWPGGAFGSTASKTRLVCSSDEFGELLERCRRQGESMRQWRTGVHSVFVFAGQSPAGLQSVIRSLTGDDAASVGEGDDATPELTVSESATFCGPMRGLSTANRQPVRVAEFASKDAERIISADRSAAFFKAEWCGVPVFVSMSREIVDLDAPIHVGNFDIRDHFMATVPLVLYTKWAFGRMAWGPQENGACLVIDDPLLKPRYGFLRFGELLQAMRRSDFSTSIAFIPWNWRRSAQSVVRLFKENPDRYSLSVHGCDHTGGEFGTREMELLAWKVKRATDRMAAHANRTGIPCDKVMVFPQGVFSEAAIGALKEADFLAAVNTEVVSVDPEPSLIRIADFWEVAIMKYHGFPLFTRRYPSQDIANFAFDILIGKPCLLVIHHDYCRDRCESLAEFIRRVNGLDTALSWKSLGGVIRGACRQRERSPGVVEVEMYASELTLSNSSNQRTRFVVTKRGSMQSPVQDIFVDSARRRWEPTPTGCRFDVELNPGERASVRMTFSQSHPNGVWPRQGLRYHVKTLVRRIASEARDNYVAPISSRFAN